MSKITVFGGRGFVGGQFHCSYKKEVIIKSRNDFEPESPVILDFISTVDNYNLSRGLPFVDVESNILTTLMILESSRKKYGSDFEFNFISSWFVYGKTDAALPVWEEAWCNPTGFYSITKRCAEQLIIAYCDTYGIPWRIMRLANVLGVGDQKVSAKKNATQHLVRELVQGRSINLYKGTYLRDFIDVRDVVRAIMLVIRDGERNQIYNIGNGEGVSISSIVDYVVDKIPESFDLVNLVDAPKFHQQVQVDNMFLDISKIEALGYAPEHELSETIDWLIDHYKNE